VNRQQWCCIRNVFYQFGVFNPHLIQICDLEFWTRIAFIRNRLCSRNFGDVSGARWFYNCYQQTSRHYRTVILDRLLSTRFCISSQLCPTSSADSRQPPVNGIDLFARAQWARMIAAFEAINPVNPDSSLLAEWKHIMHYYLISPSIQMYNWSF